MMAVLYYVIHRRGVKLGPLVIGMALAELFGSLIHLVLRILPDGISSFDFGYLDLIYTFGNIFTGAILGAALCWGFSLALKRPAQP